MIKNNFKKLLITGILGLISINCYSSGYMFGAGSTESISTALTNGAEVNNASIMFSNPAGITYLNGLNISQSIIGVNPTIKYYNAKGYYFKTHESIKGEDNAKLKSTIIAAPSFFLSKQLNDNIYAGLSIYPSMAASVDYNMTSVLRYNINKIKLIAANLQPVIAFKLNERNSIAFGAVLQYVDAKLREFADVNGGINYQLPLIGKLGYPLIPRKTDAYANLKGNDINAGFNLSWMWNINDNLLAGISYNSKINHTLKGTAQWNFYGEAFDWPVLGKLLRDGIRENGYVEKESANVDFKSPETINIHGLWKVNSRLNLLGQALWTRHSLFNELKINFENMKTVPNGKTGVTDVKSNIYLLKPVWKNSWRFGLGATYKINDKLKLRTGISYDKTPIKDTIGRFTALPDSNRLIIGIGANYTINEKSNITFAFMHENAIKSHSDANGWCGSAAELGSNSVNCISSRSNISTDFKVKANLYGIQFNRKF